MVTPCKSKICVVGMCVTDLTTYVARSPGPGETVVGSKFATGFGGKGANQAVQAAMLGSEVLMVSKVGDDQYGRDTVQNFKRRRVDTTNVVSIPDGTSGVAPIMVDGKTGENSIVIVRGVADGFTAKDVNVAADSIRSCKIMVCQLEIPLDASIAALRMGRESGMTTILNAAPVPQAAPGTSVLPAEALAVDILCVNEVELTGLAGMAAGTDDEVRAAALKLMQQGARNVVVTLGPRGYALFEEGKEGGKFFPATPTIVRDTSGAGDSFIGALAHYMAEGFPLERAALYANRIAAASVSAEGTQSSYPSPDLLVARHAIGLIDHTSLGLEDTDEGIRKLVNQAVAELPFTAAVCIYPKFIKLVRQMQESDPKAYPRTLRIATVVNFPKGNEDTEKVVADTEAAVRDGADEVDLVIDYSLLKEDAARGRAAAEALTRAVRAACPEGQVLLKVIIESGELKDPALIRTACEAAIAGGCDFVKTSTGKVPVNATPESAELMLGVVAEHNKKLQSAAAGSAGRIVGFKAAGGVRDLAASREFLKIAARQLFGDERRWLEVDDRLFRFGASSLLANLRKPPAPAATMSEAGY